MQAVGGVVSGAELRPRPRACASSASFMRGEGAMWNEGGVFVTRWLLFLWLLSKLRTPVQPPRAAGARRLHDRAPAGRARLPRDDMACRLPAICSSVSTAPRGRTAATHAAYGEGLVILVRPHLPRHPI